MASIQLSTYQGVSIVLEKFAFISRHVPTDSQVRLALEKGIELIHVGDRDGFTINPKEFIDADFRGVVVVHAQAALTCFKYGFSIGVFNNINRAPLGEKPVFETTELFITERNI
jgi:hypothetical protein